MKTRNVTQKLIQYIHEKQLSVLEIERKTKVKKEKLLPGYEGNLNATEFLELCSYLNIRPEDYHKD